MGLALAFKGTLESTTRQDEDSTAATPNPGSLERSIKGLNLQLKANQPTTTIKNTQRKGISKPVVLKETAKSLILLAARIALREVNAHSFTERAHMELPKQYLNACIGNCFIAHVKSEKRQKGF